MIDVMAHLPALGNPALSSPHWLCSTFVRERETNQEITARQKSMPFSPITKEINDIMSWQGPSLSE
jgi:hypothetical protein